MENLTRNEIIGRIRETGVIAIVRLTENRQLGAVAEAIEAGGLDIIEFTMTTPGALDAIAETAARKDDVLIGAGSVLNADMAHQAIAAGAQFIVSPNTDPRVIGAAHDDEKPAIPGAFTPTEIVRAMELGADMVKVFPANSLGPGYIKAVLAPIPGAALLPTGGVTLENAPAFFAAGASAIAVGGELVNDALVQAGNFEAITRNAKRFHEMAMQARNSVGQLQ